MTFGEAIEQLRAGNMVWREGWNGKSQWLFLQVPDSGSKMTEPYIYMVIQTPGQEVIRIPWLASQADILAYDWRYKTV